MRRVLVIGLERWSERPLAVLRASGWSVLRAARSTEVEDLAAEALIVASDRAAVEVPARRASGRHEVVVEIRTDSGRSGLGAAELSERCTGVELAEVVERLTASRPAPLGLVVGRVTLDLLRGALVAADQVVPLAPQEVALLAALVREVGQVVSRERLLVQAWGIGPRVVTRAVDHAVRRLRQRLAALDPAAAGAITAVRGHGYRIDGRPVDAELLPSALDRVQLGRRTLDLARGVIVEGPREHPLSPQERTVLRALVTARGAIVERRTLQELGGGATDNATDRMVARLRTRIEDDPHHPLYLRTVRGVGVRLVPAQVELPPPAPDLVGRGAERHRLARVGPGVTTVCGLPGAGKSALLRTVAHDLVLAGNRARWVSSRPDPDGPLAMVCRALGLPEDRIGLFDALRGSWWLLDLEDTAPEVSSELVAGAVAADPTLRVVVAARRPLGLVGEVVLELGPLPTNDARRLFARRLHAIDPAADATAPPDLDGLPLALELAAGRRASGTDPGDAAADLYAEIRRAIAALDPSVQALWVAASTFAEPVDPAALAQVYGGPVEPQLRSLTGGGLLRFEDRIEVPSAVRAAWTERSPIFEARHLEWVLGMSAPPPAEAMLALDRLRPAGGPVFETLLLTVLERYSAWVGRSLRSRLLADLEAIEHGSSGLVAHHAGLVRYGGDPERAVELARTAVARASDPWDRARAELELALARGATGSTDEAMSLLAAIDERHLTPTQRSYARLQRALTLRSDRRSSAARALLELCLQADVVPQIRQRAALTHASLAVTTDPSHADRALALIEDDALLARDRPRLLFARAWRGMALWMIDEPRRAATVLEEAAALAAELGYAVPEVEIGGTAAGVLASMGRFGAARRRLRPLLERHRGPLRGTAAFWWCVTEGFGGDPEAATEAAEIVRAEARGPVAEAARALLPTLLAHARGPRRSELERAVARWKRSPADGRGAPWLEMPIVAAVGTALLRRT